MRNDASKETTPMVVSVSGVMGAWVRCTNAASTPPSTTPVAGSDAIIWVRDCAESAQDAERNTEPTYILTADNTHSYFTYALIEFEYFAVLCKKTVCRYISPKEYENCVQYVYKKHYVCVTRANPG